MTNDLITSAEKIVENLVIKGDLSGFTPAQKVAYYNHFCQSLSLNPLTQPFQIITFQGKERLYATKDCTEQLRTIRGVSIIESLHKQVGDMYIVSVKAQDKTGRTDVGTGVVQIKEAKGDVLANAIMKAETKAKRRVTLSICGLGILDESETDTIGEHKVAPLPILHPLKDLKVEDIPDDLTYFREFEDWQAGAKCSFEGCGIGLTESVYKFSVDNYGQPLCMPHQRETEKVAAL